MTEMVVRESAYDLTELQRLGGLLSASGYFADAREMAQAAVKVMAGQELGIPPIASMMGISIIKGKVGLGAHLVAGRIKAHGYKYKIVRHDDQGCEIEFFSRADEKGQRESLGISSFTEADAKTAGIYSEMYKKYPRNMYFARAVSNGAKFHTPEVLSGLPVYTPEELGATVDAEGDVVQDATSGSDAAAQRVAQQKIAALTAAAPPAAPPAVEPTNGTPSALKSLYSQLTNFESTVKAFGWLKKDIEELSGTDREYYVILERHGMVHGNDLKGKKLGVIKDVIRELWETLERWKAKRVPPPESAPFAAGNDDLPAALGGTFESDGPSFDKEAHRG